MPTLDDEVTYLSGLNPDGTLAQNSYASWNDDNPATYTGGSTGTAKWFANASSGTAGTPGGTVLYYFDAASGWSSAEKSAFVACLNLWAAIANISFAETTDSSAASKITFKRGSDGQAFTQLGGETPSGAGVTGGTKLLRITSALVSIDTSVNGFGPITAPTSAGTFSNYGGYPWQVMMHEIGHALGLGHAGPYPVNSVPPPSVQYSAYDSRLYTIMSYIRPSDGTATYYSQYAPSGTNWGTQQTGGFIYPREAVTWMPADILAIQRLYGTAASTPLSGGITFGYDTNIAGAIANFFNFSKNNSPILTLWATGTNNALDLRNSSEPSTINLNPGTFSSTHSLTNNIAIAYGTRIDRFMGTVAVDNVTGNNNGDYIDGYLGDDVIQAGTGNDTLLGNSGDDRITGGPGTNSIDGGAGNDTAVYTLARANYTFTANSDGSVTINGAGLVDTLRDVEFLAFSDQTVATNSVIGQQLTGGPGNDTLVPTSGDDFIDGNGGIDTLTYAGAGAAVTVDLAVTIPQATGGSATDQIRNVEGLIGSVYADTLRGAADTKLLSGGNGNDKIFDKGAGSTINGGDGIDTLNLDRSASATALTWTFTPESAGPQTMPDGTTVANIEHLLLTTGTGDDLVKFNGLYGYSNFGDFDYWNGGPGNDTVEVDLRTTSSTLNGNLLGAKYQLNTDSAPGRLRLDLENVENIIFRGGSNPDFITGLAGDDSLFGYGGNDALNGGDGNDSIEGGAGHDTLNGGAGIDILSFASDTTGVTVNLLAGTAGGASTGNDAVSNFENITGGSGNDSLTGNAGDNLINGGAGHDTLNGGAGIDTVSFLSDVVGITASLAAGTAGGTASGNDALANFENIIGGYGDDILGGDAGDNILDGAAGFDLVSYTLAAAGVTVDLALSGPQGTGGAGTDRLFNMEGIIGSSYNDTLWGDGANNTLQGGTGVNFLDGRGGFDTAVYAGARSNYTVTRNSNGTVSITGGGVTDTLSNFEKISFSDSVLPLLAKVYSDFNGDGRSDILWRDRGNGNNQGWYFSNGGLAAAPLPAMAASYSVAGLGDFNGDGYSDVLWRESSSGNNVGWFFSATGLAGAPLPTMATSFSVAGIGDFNGDGRSDILWRDSSTGDNQGWYFGSSGLAAAPLPTMATGFSVAGIGDFNGDGYSDVLWRNNAGNNLIWYFSATGLATAPLTAMAASYSVAGIGDFNGDARSDILWRDSTGNNQVWHFGSSGFSAAPLPAMQSSYSVAAVGDYNSDGRSDIIWRDSGTGDNQGWYFGANGVAAAPLPGMATSFSMADSRPPRKRAVDGDFNGDGRSDLLWRESGSGSNQGWYFSTTGLAAAALPAMATTASVAGIGDFNGDNYSDVLWRDNSGNNVGWFFSGTGLAGAPLPTMATSFAVAGIGDFNGDGRSDILWRDSSTGNNQGWYFGASGLAAAPLPAMATGYAVAGIGDFNGDGYSDVFWRNNAGNTQAWFFSATGLAGAPLPSMASSYTVAGVGDFNGDGRSDILWRDNAGNNQGWFFSATGLNTAPLPSMPAGYSVAAVGDYNADGFSDIIWRDNAGNNQAWYFNATGLNAAPLPGMIPSYAIPYSPSS